MFNNSLMAVTISSRPRSRAAMSWRTRAVTLRRLRRASCRRAFAVGVEIKHEALAVAPHLALSPAGLRLGVTDRHHQ